MKVFAYVVALLLLVLSSHSLALAPDSRNVTTQHNDNKRSGATLGETILNTSNVNDTSFGKLFERPVDEQIYTQPLWLANVSIAGGTHNVVYVATNNNTVYAFDADDPSLFNPLVSRNLIPAGGSAILNSDVGQGAFCPGAGNYKDFSGKIGIVSTPVVDVATNTIYLLMRYKQSGNFFNRLHALDIVTLADKPGSPVAISASLGGVTFNAKFDANRVALTLAGNNVYLGFASYCDVEPYHGWVLGYDKSSLSQTFKWTATPSSGTRSGIWQSGQGFAVDSVNNLYFMTGNGTSQDTMANAYGEAFVRLNPGNLSPVVTFFVPFNVASLNAADADLGAAGILLPPDVANRAIGGGKQGKLYVVNTAAMGGFTPGGPDNVVQSFFASAGHIHSSPIFYSAPGINKKLIYIWGEFDFLKAFDWNGNNFSSTTPFKQGTVRVPDGMPGGQISISANGSVDNTGVLWATHTYVGDGLHATSPGILRAFDAKDVSKELWNSRFDTPNNDYGLFAKNPPPTIANGKVYVATFGNKLAVYGIVSQGLRADYFDNLDFTNQKVSRIDATVNNDWGPNAPDPNISPDTFSVRWTGQVQPQFTQTYTFYTLSDDGVRLFVNNQLIINNFTDHGPVENSGNIALTAGVKYNIKMEYYDNGVNAVAKLSWSSPSQPKQIIPANRLFPNTVRAEFQSSSEGWSNIQSLTSSFSTGVMTETITGANPQMQGPDGLEANAAFFKAVRIRMKNNTSDTVSQLYWQTTASPTYDESRHVDFMVVPNDTKYREYVIDLTGNANWTGIIKRIRIDPLKNATSGSANFGAIRLSSYTGFADRRKYRLIARHSGKVADVPGSSTANGVQYQQFTYNGGNNQLFEIIDLGGSFNYIVPQQSQFNKKCSDVNAASVADGAAIQQFDCNFTFAQHFAIVAVGGGLFRITNRNSNKSWDVQGVSQANGAKIVQFTYGGGLNQQWQLIGVE